MKLSQEISLLFLVLILAILIRFWPVAVPPSLNWDEVSLGYNAYSILQTGKDEWGRQFPLSFEAFGDYKLPGYIYSLIPFIAIFGLSEWVIRLPSQIAGVLSVLVIFFIINLGTKNKKLALISAILLAISPWHLFLSRVALEANLALFYFLIGLYCYLLGFRRSLYFLLAVVFWGVTIFTYNSARVFLPLFILGIILLDIKKLLVIKKSLIAPLILGLVFIGGAFFLAISQDSSSRYYWVTILDQGAINYLDESRNSSTLPGILTNLIYNRYVYFIQNFVANYISHYSPEFLFIKGGSNYQFSVPNLGLLYLWELPFLVLGLLKIKSLGSFGWKILLWLLLAPIPAAITRESPHALRSIFMIGSLQVFVGLGVLQSFEYLKKYQKIFNFGLIFLIILSSLFYLYNYFLVYPKKYSQSWQYSNKQMFEYLEPIIKEKKALGEEVYISKVLGEPHIFYLFNTKYDPDKYQKNPTLVRYTQTNWRWVDRLDNIVFINDWEVKEKLEGKKGKILVTSPKNYPENSKVLNSFYFLNGDKSYDIVEIN